MNNGCGDYEAGEDAPVITALQANSVAIVLYITSHNTYTYKENNFPSIQLLTYNGT